MINVLFVCLGNICRSPMAEAIFKDLVDKEGLGDQFYIDSVGTSSYHVGDSAHPGTRRILAEHGLRCDSRSRQISDSDLVQADYLIAMDHSNKSNLLSRTRSRSIEGEIDLLLNFADDTSLSDVPDPYYTGNFEEVYQMVRSGCQGLLRYIREEHGI